MYAAQGSSEVVRTDFTPEGRIEPVGQRDAALSASSPNRLTSKGVWQPRVIELSTGSAVALSPKKGGEAAQNVHARVASGARIGNVPGLLQVLWLPCAMEHHRQTLHLDRNRDEILAKVQLIHAGIKELVIDNIK
jgi:hypothetical protein